MLVETDIESGLRWGELTELRPRDLDFGTGVLTVSRVVVETSPPARSATEARSPAARAGGGPRELQRSRSGSLREPQAGEPVRAAVDAQDL
jgi:integrase